MSGDGAKAPSGPDGEGGNALPTTGEDHHGSGVDAVERAVRRFYDDHRAALDRPGDCVGPYKLLEQIGEGGFGVVWLAERREPMVQRVALKVIKPGMDSRSVLARFEAERQALALMSHPNVARVFDAGTTGASSRGGAGRPYFVMEHVRGGPITRYCDEQRLTIEQRLELFAAVCDAVHHAHMKGIIHRDLKPSNILVTIAESGVPRPVVIDFGVAKALCGRLTDQTLHTELGAMIGTPEYMSPEQAEMSEADIDTRADVYALGAILYELLAGAVPFDPRTLRAAGYAAIQRMIREQEPPRPSTRLSSMGEAGRAVAAARRAPVGDLATRLRSELEWIPLKALRKDRAERYRSAAEMGDDVRNYLQHKPLIAGPEAAGYKLRKFVRRNKVMVGAGAIVVAALVVAAAISLWFGLSESAARRRETLERQRADTQADAARRSEALMREVVAFQARMLDQVEPSQMGGSILDAFRKGVDDAAESFHSAGRDARDGRRAVETLARFTDRTRVAQDVFKRHMLDPAAQDIERNFADRPLMQATLRRNLAAAYAKLGLQEDAERQLRQALLAAARSDTAGKIEALRISSELGGLLVSEGRLSEAGPFCREADTGLRSLVGDDDPHRLAAAQRLGEFHLYEGSDMARAAALLQEAYDGRRALLGEDHPDTIQSLLSLGQWRQFSGDIVGAVSLSRLVVERRAHVLGEDHFLTMEARALLGVQCRWCDRLEESRQELLDAYDAYKHILGAAHPASLDTLCHLAMTEQHMGLLDSARPRFEAVGRAAGADTSLLGRSEVGLAWIERAQGNAEGAERHFRDSFERLSKLIGSSNRLAAVSAVGLAGMLARRGLFADARDLIEPNLVLLTSDRSTSRFFLRNGLQDAVDLYDSWEKAEPHAGHDLKASEWRVKLEQFNRAWAEQDAAEDPEN